ncbi:hypothetical protein VT84_30165 [Gemmata sp. SH-PL17]|uniref:hypothetical protein n=1 Tax=Gemmata sp. SH-PL17 TaxID=1630693 RepID=UPI00078C468E|nr:hypothetical protein [Gemmata sp. SH-PL17]AMV28709.1 hypothetical protein VT84_30165 [Gemmata sp. SH-PL17]
MRTVLAMGLATIIGFGFGGAVRAEDEVGPHKGPVAEWGDEEYHLEVVADAKTGDVTVYVYGNHSDLHKGRAKAIEAKSLVLALKTTDPATTVKLEAKPAKDDPQGKSSVFVAKNDAFKTDKKLAGTISGKLGTKPYSGDFKQK